MGYQTRWIGYLDVTPRLNPTEIDLVNKMAHSIYVEERTPGPRALDEHEAAIRVFAAGRPRGWLTWSACPDGCCLAYDGGDKPNDMVPWLHYLMDTFPGHGAAAASVPGSFGLTCDHRLNGVVVGERRDNRELYSITVRDNDVEVELLGQGHSTNKSSRSIDTVSWSPTTSVATASSHRIDTSTLLTIENLRRGPCQAGTSADHDSDRRACRPRTHGTNMGVGDRGTARRQGRSRGRGPTGSSRSDPRIRSVILPTRSTRRSPGQRCLEPSSAHFECTCCCTCR